VRLLINSISGTLGLGVPNRNDGFTNFVVVP